MSAILNQTTDIAASRRRVSLGPWTGTTLLLRLAIRTDRWILLGWLTGTLTYLAFAVGAVLGLYPTAEDRQTYAATSAVIRTERIFNGPGLALDTAGGIAIYETGGYLLAVIGLMAILLVVRHARAPEETSQAELLAAGSLGRLARPCAALLLATATSCVIGIGVAIVLIAHGLDPIGSATYGAGLALTGLVFAAIAALTSQLSAAARVASGTAGIVLAASYLVRGMGDLNGTWLSKASPLGWVQALRPFAGEQLWPVLPTTALAGTCIALAFWVASRRDLGAGLSAAKPGPAAASAALRTIPGLAIRNQRWTIISWAGGLGLLTVALGAVSDGVVDLTGTSPASGIPWKAGDMVDGYFAFAALVCCVIAAGAGVSLVLRTRTEERGGRLEPVLAGAIGRGRWFAWQWAVAVGGAIVIVLACGVGLAAGRAIAVDADLTGQILQAACVQIPAVVCLVSFAGFVAAAWPRRTFVAWIVVGYVFVVAALGEILDLPDWVQALSPFDHVPIVPLESAGNPVLAVLTAAAAVLFAAAWGGFRRRDVPVG